MRVIEDVPSTEQYGGAFSGRVAFSMLREAPDASVPDVALVHFHDGAATHWHRHPGGQLLWVVAGSGRVGVEGGDEVTLTPGVLVETPAGELHYHGASAQADAELLTLTWGTTDWSERPAPAAETGEARA